jgi:hypothetical protein
MRALCFFGRGGVWGTLAQTLQETWLLVAFFLFLKLNYYSYYFLK